MTTTPPPSTTTITTQVGLSYKNDWGVHQNISKTPLEGTETNFHL